MPTYHSPSELLSSTYTGFTPSEIVEAGGYRYQVAPSSATPGSIETAGGVYLHPLPSGSRFNVEQAAIAKDGTTDVSAPLNAYLSALPEGAIVDFASDGRYKACIEQTKALRLYGNGATLIALDGGGYLINMHAGEYTKHTVTENELPFGTRTFTVSGASSKFAVGDIGTLHDGAVRPSDSADVNFLVVKIEEIDGDTITIEGFTRSHMGTDADIKFWHNPNQLKGATVVGFEIEGGANNQYSMISIRDCEFPYVHDIRSSGSGGPVIDLRRVYNFKIGDSHFRDPQSVGSGQGYGISLFGASEGTVGTTTGHGMRHVFDCDSTYGLTCGWIKDPAAAGSAVGLGHNGFCGFFSIKGVDASVPYGVRAVSHSAQGYGTGSSNALKINHPIRHGHIGTVRAIARGWNANQGGTTAVYFQNTVQDLQIDRIESSFEDQTPLDSTAQSIILRIDGATLGVCRIGSIKGDRCAFVYDCIDPSSEAEGLHGEMVIDEIMIDKELWRIAYVNGAKLNLKIGGGIVGDIKGDSLVKNVGERLNRLDLGPIEYQGYDVKLVDTGSLGAITNGSVFRSSRATPSAVHVTAGGAISAEDIHNRSDLMTILGPIGTGTVTLTGFAGPVVEGERVSLAWYSGYHDIVIPESLPTMWETITLDANNPKQDIICVSGLWRKV